MQRNSQQDASQNDILVKTVRMIQKQKPELFKKVVKKQNQNKIILQEIIQQQEELEQCKKFHEELKQDFSILEKLIYMAIDNQ